MTEAHPVKRPPPSNGPPLARDWKHIWQRFVEVTAVIALILAIWAEVESKMHEAEAHKAYEMLGNLYTLYVNDRRENGEKLASISEFLKAGMKSDSSEKSSFNNLLVEVGKAVAAGNDKLAQSILKNANINEVAQTFYNAALALSCGCSPGDIDRARGLYTISAALGNKDAQSALGVIYRDGTGVDRDYVKSRGFFEKAAAQGDADAEVSLGYFYSNALGVEQDYVEALKWFRMAAAQNDAVGEYDLGLAFENGRGVEPDLVQARKLYEQAANNNEADAQDRLALFYEKGLGNIAPSKVTARKWYQQAANNGNDHAKDWLKQNIVKS